MSFLVIYSPIAKGCIRRGHSGLVCCTGRDLEIDFSVLLVKGNE
jgi:hypothetical protein